MKCLYIFVLHMLVKSLEQVGTSQIIKIGKPELSCGEDGGIIQIKTETTKLRLQGYSQASFSVNSERAFSCTNPQSCPLMSWKIIRNLEMYLNGNFKNTGSNGIVEFRNDMLIPGFNYLLHVTLKNPFGEIEQNDYNLTYFNGEDKFNNVDILRKLDLNVQSMNRYKSLPIIINANVTVCGNIQYYYFKWFLVKENDEMKLPWKSSELSILPSSLLNENEIIAVIKCQVVNFENDIVILEDWKRFRLIDTPNVVDEVKVVLPFKYTTLNKDAPISIVPYIYVSKNLDYKLEWSCIFEKTFIFACQKETNAQFFMEMGFNEEGNYSITLTVISGNIKKAATCYVSILHGVPSIEFDLAYPIRPEEGIEISAKISELRTYCTVQWFGDQDNQSSLQGTPDFTTTIYNISATDKSFLAEMVEFGRVTVTRDFKFKIPPPSRTWPGLATKNYQIKLAVTCPTLREIYDENVIKEMPDEFMTISGQIEFFVPPSPTVKFLDVFSEGGKALSSEYYYVVQPIDSGSDSLMVYKFGFILERIEVVFFSGNDVFGASTVLPYNEDYGIETFVEVCNYENRCGKKFGPLVKPSINYDLDDKEISKNFKQKLTEENFYAVFSYAFIILHSSKFVNQNQKFSNIFSSELSLKLKEMLGENSSKFVDNNFMNSLVTFIGHLQFSDELMLQLSQITQEFLTNSHYRKRIPRQASGNSLPAPEDLEKLGEIKNYMITSEYIILNSDDSDSVAKEKSHMISLLDRWMDKACKIIFKGQRIQNVEMKTAIFTIEKMSEKNLNTFMIVPFDFNAWNLTTHMKINNLAHSSSLCIGHIMLKGIFEKKDVVFGTKIFSGDKEWAEINFPAEITIFLPKTQDALQSECFVHENGLDLQCSSKELDSFVECVCPTFGYYFLVSGNNTFQNTTEKSNKTSDGYDNIFNENARRLGEKISYVIIISSLVGFLILCYIIRKLTIYPQQNFGVDGFSDSYQYGNIFHEDTLS